MPAVLTQMLSPLFLSLWQTLSVKLHNPTQEHNMGHTSGIETCKAIFIAYERHGLALHPHRYVAY